MVDSEPSSSTKISVLFVCLGNICRSTMAEAVFRCLTHNLTPSSPSSPSTPSTTPTPPHPEISHIDSAGTAAYHALSAPDPRTLATLSSHSIHNYTHSARKITAQDFSEFDYILGMDRENLADLRAMKERVDRKKGGAVSKASVRLFGEFGGMATSGGGRRAGGRAVGEEVVDPYYGADDGFEICFEQVQRFGRAFLKEVVEKERKEDDERSKNEVDGHAS